MGELVKKAWQKKNIIKTDLDTFYYRHSSGDILQRATTYTQSHTKWDIAYITKILQKNPKRAMIETYCSVLMGYYIGKVPLRRWNN